MDELAGAKEVAAVAGHRSDRRRVGFVPVADRHTAGTWPARAGRDPHNARARRAVARIIEGSRS